MTDSHPEEATTGDHILMAIMAFLAFVVTGPGTYAALSNTRFGGAGFFLAIIVAAAWNVVIVGIPIMLTAKHWYDHVLETDDDFRPLSRVYWQLQLATLMFACVLSPLMLALFYMR